MGSRSSIEADNIAAKPRHTEGHVPSRPRTTPRSSLHPGSRMEVFAPPWRGKPEACHAFSVGAGVTPRL